MGEGESFPSTNALVKPYESNLLPYVYIFVYLIQVILVFTVFFQNFEWVMVRLYKSTTNSRFIVFYSRVVLRIISLYCVKQHIYYFQRFVVFVCLTVYIFFVVYIIMILRHILQTLSRLIFTKCKVSRKYNKET